MIHVLIADDAGLMRDAMRRILDEQDGIYVVGGAATTTELHYLLPNADVLLIGAAFDGKHLLALMREILASKPDLRVLIVGVPDEPDLILRFVEAGVSGYVLRQESIDVLVQKVHAAFNNQALVSPAIAAQLMKRVAALANQALPLAFMEAKAPRIRELTNREVEVLSLVSQGLANRAIGARLQIREGTVKNHVHKILRKLEVKSRLEAAAIYRLYRGQYGMLSPSPNERLLDSPAGPADPR